MEEVIVYTDGASRGNPGPAGIGVMLCTREGKILREISEYAGELTNNAAEYLAVIRGLEEAHDLQAKKAVVVTDSELLVRQMKGMYKVKHQGLRELHERVKQQARRFEKVGFVHIRRERNTRADELAKKGSKAK